MYSLDNRHKWALPYWARPGIATFAKPADGGGGDDDDLDDDDDDDDGDDDDPDEDKSEDELRAELKRVRASLKTANGSSAKRRKRARDLQRQLDEARAGSGKGGKPKGGKGGDDDDDVDVDAIRAAATAEARKASDERIKRSEGKSALLAAGVPADKVKRAVGLLDLSDLDVDDDGEVDGLEDAVDALKDEWPELFAKPGARRKRESVAGDGDRNGERGERESKTKSASQKQADALLGRKSA